MSGRERYDDRITAGELRSGDELHLTFMGGDDYVYVDGVRAATGGKVKWWGTSWGGEIGDTIPASEEVWIRKRVTA